MRLLAWCAIALATSLQASQVRDIPQTSPGTAVLTGLVTTDEANGQPIRRALVTVVAGDGRQQYQTSTDDRGRFTVRNLPPGNVRLIVAKPGYVQTYYGARQPGSTVGLPIALTNGQTADVAVRLPRGAVITGTVRDESGQPMPGISLQVQRVTDQPRRGIDRYPSCGGYLERQELTHQRCSVTSDAHRAFTHHVEFVGGRPFVLVGQIDDGLQFFGLGKPAQLPRGPQPVHRASGPIDPKELS